MTSGVDFESLSLAEIIRLKDGGLFKLIGHYDDELVRENGQWLFLRRNYQPQVLEEPGG